MPKKRLNRLTMSLRNAERPSSYPSPIPSSTSVSASNNTSVLPSSGPSSILAVPSPPPPPSPPSRAVPRRRAGTTTPYLTLDLKKQKKNFPPSDGSGPLPNELFFSPRGLSLVDAAQLPLLGATGEKVSVASLLEMVLKPTNEHPDLYYMDDFFVLSRVFMPPRELLSAMEKMQSPLFLQRVGRWIALCPYLAEDVDFVSGFKKIADSVEGGKELMRVARRCAKRRKEELMSLAPRVVDEMAPQLLTRPPNFLDLKVSEVVEQMSLIERSLFLELKESDCIAAGVSLSPSSPSPGPSSSLSGSVPLSSSFTPSLSIPASSSTHKSHLNPHVYASYIKWCERLEKVRSWVITEILTRPVFEDRVLALSRLVEICHLANRQGNIQLAYAVRDGLASPYVTRLRKTWAAVSNEVNAMFNAVVMQSMPHKTSFAAYVKHVQSAHVYMPNIELFFVQMERVARAALDSGGGQGGSGGPTNSGSARGAGIGLTSMGTGAKTLVQSGGPTQSKFPALEDGRVDFEQLRQLRLLSYELLQWQRKPSPLLVPRARLYAFLAEPFTLPQEHALLSHFSQACENKDGEMQRITLSARPNAGPLNKSGSPSTALSTSSSSSNPLSLLSSSASPNTTPNASLNSSANVSSEGVTFEISSGKFRVLHGKAAAVLQLMHDEWVRSLDENFAFAVAAGQPLISTSIEYFNALIAPLNISVKKVTREVKDGRARVCDVFRLWVRMYAPALRRDAPFLRRFSEWVRGGEAKFLWDDERVFYTHVCDFLSRKTPRVTGAPQSTVMGSLRDRYLPLAPEFDREKIFAKDFAKLAAEAVTWINQELLNAISPDELVFKRYMDAEKSPHVSEMVAQFNRVSQWGASLIVNEKELGKRKEILAQLIAMAHECLQLRNYDSAYALVAGLENSSVSRLKRTWDGLPGKVKEKYKNLKDVFEFTNNYRRYREDVTRADPPIIPFLANYTKALFAIEDANAPMTESGEVNFSRFNMIIAQISELRTYKSFRYTHLCDPAFVAYFVVGIDEVILTEKQQYENSKAIEPNPAKK